MSESIRAIYVNGVFQPLETLSLPENHEVRLQIESAQTQEPSQDGETADEKTSLDPLAGIRVSTGLPDLAENFDDYRFGKRNP